MYMSWHHSVVESLQVRIDAQMHGLAAALHGSSSTVWKRQWQHKKNGNINAQQTKNCGKDPVVLSPKSQV